MRKIKFLLATIMMLVGMTAYAESEVMAAYVKCLQLSRFELSMAFYDVYGTDSDVTENSYLTIYFSMGSKLG